MRHLTTVREALQTVFSNKAYVAGFVLASALVFAAYVAVPVVLIPGNTPEVYIAATPWTEFVVLAILALLTGVLLTLNWFAYRNPVTKMGIEGSYSSVSVLTSLFASPKCPMCLAAIFGFMGFGSILFLVENQLPIALAGTILLMGAIYFSSKKVIVKCSECK